ncbi:Bax protein [Vibrio xiamenensis]|uniref:Bax protein n=1 Tax=Vibrio xiamenensis TaxID=861298 RepID=A0A1G7YD09_9VIBR|nr:glucosaminidase domain-containing protein [Vibrio xiamenensis]SDG94206.1 Bax protein [Vibrio xiamenensis]
MRKTEFFALLATVIVAIYGYLAYQHKLQQAEDIAFDWAITPKKVGKAPDFGAIRDTRAKKQHFFDYLRPGIAFENQRILKERNKLKNIEARFDKMALTASDKAFLDKLANRYNVAFSAGGIDKVFFEQLLSRVNVIPEALVLVQAANESAWGTSRFARKANNYFGQWCYQQGCGLVPKQRADGMSHEVAKFSSVQESIHRYFMNVNRNRAYKDLREQRRKRQQSGKELHSVAAAVDLADGLLKYSERGDDYVSDLKVMIRHNEHFWTHREQ